MEGSEKKEKKSKKGAVAVEDDEVAAIADITSPMSLCDKLKPAAHASVECLLVLPALPPTFFHTPLLLDVTFTREKKSTSMQLSFPLVYKYFAAMLNVASVPTLDEFHDTVLGTNLAAEDASSIAATIPLFPLLPPAPTSSPEGDVTDGKKKKKKSKDDDHSADPTKWSAPELEDKKKEVLLFALPAIKAALRLHTMDVFTDSTTLYGQVVGRKSHAAKCHLAFLFQDVAVEIPSEEEGGASTLLPALSITLKGCHPGMLEAAVQEIAAILADEGRKLCGGPDDGKKKAKK